MDDNKVLRTFYIDDDIDEEIRAWVGGEGFGSALFCHWLAAGMKAVDAGARLPPSKAAEGPPVMRTVWVSAQLDSRLRREAFIGPVPRVQLVMGYLRLGKESASALKRVLPKRHACVCVQGKAASGNGRRRR